MPGRKGSSSSAAGGGGSGHASGRTTPLEMNGGGGGSSSGRRSVPPPPSIDTSMGGGGGGRLSRAGSGDSLEDSRGDGGKKLALGHSVLSEARRMLKRTSKEKSPPARKWDVIRQNLLGPQGPVLRATLSGTYGSAAEVASVNDARLSSGAGGGKVLPRYGALDEGDVEAGPAADLPVVTRVGEHMKQPSGALPVVAAAGGGSAEEKAQRPVWLRALLQVLMCRYMNVLMIFLPFGVISGYAGWGAGPTFILNFLGLIPLAAILGDFTEEVAEHLGDTIGGLVNASFGNLMEMVIGVQALARNEIRVVQASMLGSILSNLLLVTGSCFLVGGLIHREQRFNSVAGVANLSLLFLATMALVVPTPIGKSYNLSMHDVLLISRVAACFLLSMYLQLIVFQLVTHRHLFEGDDQHHHAHAAATAEERVGLTHHESVRGLGGSLANGNGNGNGNGEEEEEREEDEPGFVQLLVRKMTSTFYEEEDEDEAEDGEEPVDLGLWGSMVGLFIVAFIVSCFSDLVVDSIDGMSKSYGVSKTFVGVILLPLVGNATEHMTAVTVAAKNRMELAMGIAVGSATQVALFVVPFLVIAGWIMGRDMSLEFPPIEVIIFVMSVLLTMPVLLNAQSNWLIGSLLITCYCFCAFAFWFEQPSPLLDPTGAATTKPYKEYKIHG